MDTTTVINELTEERDRIVAAIAALTGGRRRRGRPAKSGPGARRKMSPAVKRRLSLIAKARWAKAKKAGKTRL